jgi:hypothetical protein
MPEFHSFLGLRYALSSLNATTQSAQDRHGGHQDLLVSARVE